MSYKIRITKTEVVKVKKSEYQKIAETGNEIDGKAQFGYVPYEKQEEKDIDILSTTTEDLNINDVVNAIFKIKP